MSTKTQVMKFAQNHDRFTTREMAETLDLNVSTVRKAIAYLVEANELKREDDNSVSKKTKVTRAHSKPKIANILRPKFDAALHGVNVVIPVDATLDEKREQKTVIKAALDTVTYGNTIAEIASMKNFTKYSESHLSWYKSQYLRQLRAEYTEAETLVAEAV